jgi:hypothetical protein
VPEPRFDKDNQDAGGWVTVTYEDGVEVEVYMQSKDEREETERKARDLVNKVFGMLGM